MNLSDLRIFTVVARHDSLRAAAEELHLTPSAVSKALQRLEEDLEIALFDRGPRQLLINANGQRLLTQARTLLELAQQARSDLQGARARLDCRIGGPAVLLWREAESSAEALAPWPDARLHLQALFEGDALAALARGELDAALVTDEALHGTHWSAEWEATSLGRLALGLFAGRVHPLSRKRGPIGIADVLAHPFASPSRSLFCGQARGDRSDGWRDDLHPRTIRYRADDLQVLLGLVRSGMALVWLPCQAVRDGELVEIVVSDLRFSSAEQVRLVWNRRTAPQWLRTLADALAKARAQ